MEITSLTKAKLVEMFSQNKRFDGRKLNDFRDLSIEYGVSNKAEGSARVRLGKTEVVVGVKMGFGAPYPDSPDKGNLSVSADLLPLASPKFEMGPPGFEAIELPRLVDRVIRESHVIHLDQLVITPGEKVWTVYVDIYPINDDGNLIDVATIGALAALTKATVPELDKDGKIDHHKPSKKKLPMDETLLPLSFSFFKIGNQIVLDPTREEEEASDSRITFGLSTWNKKHMINSCQKAGEANLSSPEVAKMMEILPKKYDEIIAKLKKFL